MSRLFVFREHFKGGGLIDTLRLIGPRLLVLRDPPESATSSGLVIPDGAQTPKEKVLEGTVILVGPGKPAKKGSAMIGVSAKPGDRVLYGFLDGHDFTEDGREYVILEDSEVRAVLGVATRAA